MQAKHSKVYTSIAKSPILNVWLSSEYGYSIYNTTDLKEWHLIFS